MTDTWLEEPTLDIYEDDGYGDYRGGWRLNADTVKVTARAGGRGLYGSCNGNISALRIKNNPKFIARLTAFDGCDLNGNSQVYYGDKDRTGDRTNSIAFEMADPQSLRVDCCTGAKSGPICGNGAYADTGSSTCTGLLRNTCSKNVDQLFCRNWCMANPGECDLVAATFCKKYPNDPFCTCVNSKVNTIKGSANPACLDMNCIKTGYQTKSMISTRCPDIIDCSVQAALVSTGTTLNASMPIEQNCGAAHSDGSGSGGGSGTIDYSGPTSPSGAPAAGLSAINWPQMMVLLFIVLILGAIAFMVGRRDRPVRPRQK